MPNKDDVLGAPVLATARSRSRQAQTHFCHCPLQRAGLPHQDTSQCGSGDGSRHRNGAVFGANGAGESGPQGRHGSWAQHTHTQAQAQQSSGTSDAVKRVCGEPQRPVFSEIKCGWDMRLGPTLRRGRPPSRHHRCRVPSSYFVTEGVRHNARSHSSTYLAVSTQRSTSIWRRSPTAHTSSTCV